MDIQLFNDYIVIVVVGICLCIGYVIKTSLDFIPNKYIPLMMLLLGMMINMLLNLEDITANVILAGMISGLASTGLYEAFRNLLGGGNNQSYHRSKD